MELGGLGQFWGAEFKNRWHAGVGRGFQPHSHDLGPRFGKSERPAILKSKRQGKFW